jgi:mannose-6-phosphate isomerase-like protein (cupin superfamily)
VEWLVSVDDIRSRIRDGDKRSFYPIRHGSMRVGLYAPRGTDPQVPHTQDEVYIVQSGSGTFAKGEERRPFKAGDVIFVEAGIAHRFEDFGDDFETWVVFWGPDGGETA